MLDARKRRREEALEAGRLPDPLITRPDDTAPDPEGEALAADAVGAALLVVLETLQPAERLAFVLHDLFAVPFEDIALIVDRSPAAARQLASRARRRVQGADRDAPTADRQIVDAFLAAARGGDFEGLLALLDPDVVLRADDGGGALQIVEGARAVATRARFFSTGRAAHPAIVDGAAGFVATEAGVPVAVLAFTVVDGRITAMRWPGRRESPGSASRPSSRARRRPSSPYAAGRRREHTTSLRTKVVADPASDPDAVGPPTGEVPLSSGVIA
jgi:hypothetical protein